MSKEFIKRLISSIILIPLSLFFIIKGAFLFNIFLLVSFLITTHEWYTISKKKNYQIFGFIFLLFSFYSAYNLRNNFDDQSLTIFLIIIITCISTDIGGYFFGKTFQGPKLTKISPKKTYAGVLGGYILSILSIFILLNHSYLYIVIDYAFSVEIFIIILLISTISQIGDIIISYFKRLSKVKNTGKIIPGHGGLLDRIDGMIFAFPSSYLILIINNF